LRKLNQYQFLEADYEKSQLKDFRKMEPTAIGIGAISEEGIFVLTGTGAYNHAGPALALSLLLQVLPGICSALLF
jgi:APA family basic amino acid/polyamine antiporter